MFSDLQISSVLLDLLFHAMIAILTYMLTIGSNKKFHVREKGRLAFLSEPILPACF